MAEPTYGPEIEELLQKYGAKPIPMDKARLADARPLSEKVSHEESKKDREIRQKSWMATRDKPVGC